jgi:hypothetical protein
MALLFTAPEAARLTPRVLGSESADEALAFAALARSRERRISYDEAARECMEEFPSLRLAYRKHLDGHIQSALNDPRLFSR